MSDRPMIDERPERAGDEPTRLPYGHRPTGDDLEPGPLDDTDAARAVVGLELVDADARHAAALERLKHRGQLRVLASFGLGIMFAAELLAVAGDGRSLFDTA